MRSRARARWVPLAMVLVPLVGAFVHLLVLGWQPQGDTAIIMLRSWDVLHGHPPLLGQNSTAGATDAAFAGQHPGPLHYYLLAPFVALWGTSPVGGLVGSLILHGGLMVLAVEFARRHLGSLATLGTAGVLAVSELIIGARIVEPWNPWPAMLGLVAALVLAWAILEGSASAPAWYAAVASLAAQSHLGLLPVIGLLTLGLAVSLGVQNRRHAVRDNAHRRGRHVVLAAGIGVVCWLPVLIETMTRSPSNLSQMFAFATSDAPQRAGLVSAVDILTRWIGPGLPDLGAVAHNPVSFFFGLDLAQASPLQQITLVTRPGMLLVLGSVAVLLSAARGKSWARSRSWAPVALAGLVTLACVLALAAINLDPRTGTIRLIYGILYLPALLMLWPLGARAVDRQWLNQRGTRWGRRRGVWLLALVCLGVGASPLIQPPWMESAETIRAQREVAAAAVQAAQSIRSTSGQQAVLLEASDPSAVAQFETMELALVTHGFAVYAPATYTTNPHNDFRSADAAPATATVLTVRDVLPGHPVPALGSGERVVASIRHTDFFYQDGVWRLSVRAR